MKITAYAMMAGTFVPMLRALSDILAKGAAHAQAKGFDPAVLVNARLAPDMFPLARQVQLACSYARDAAAVPSGRERMTEAETDRTFDEMQARIGRTIEFVMNTSEAAFDGCEDRQYTVPVVKEWVVDVNGLQLLRDWTIPHFYFHVVTAYDILRHNGVDVGKRDYMPHAKSLVRPLPEA